MPDSTNRTYTYPLGKITFIVTPVYSTSNGENLIAILLKLMEAEMDKN